LHTFAIVWKLLLVLIPPSKYGGGWPAFVAAIFCIGMLTVVVADLATLLGCCLGIPDGVTAITLVAMGTSVPDTFASRTAAKQNDYADDAIGNITGSNCINVFLGLGLPWTLASLYWAATGTTDKWRLRYGKSHSHYEGGFIVPAKSLGWSIMYFCSVAVVCISLLLWRRFKCGGELGGSSFVQRRDATFLFCLWLAYVMFSTLFMVALD